MFFQDDALAWDLLWETTPGLLACSIADRIDWRVLGIGSFVLIYLVFKKGYIGKITLRDLPTGPKLQLTGHRGVAVGLTRSWYRDLDVFSHLPVHRND